MPHFILQVQHDIFQSGKESENIVDDRRTPEEEFSTNSSNWRYEDLQFHCHRCAWPWSCGWLSAVGCCCGCIDAVACDCVQQMHAGARVFFESLEKAALASPSQHGRAGATSKDVALLPHCTLQCRMQIDQRGARRYVKKVVSYAAWLGLGLAPGSGRLHACRGPGAFVTLTFRGLSFF